MQGGVLLAEMIECKTGGQPVKRIFAYKCETVEKSVNLKISLTRDGLNKTSHELVSCSESEECGVKANKKAVPDWSKCEYCPLHWPPFAV